MSNRSGSPYSAPRDANKVPLLMAASTADGITPVVLEADPSTHLLQVSSSGGTQYTDGAAAVTHPIGTQPVFTNGSNVVTAVSTSNPLPITGTISVGSTTDESAFTAGTSTTGPIAGVFNDSVATLTSGQQGTIRATTNRGLHTNLRNSSGTEIGTASNNLIVGQATAANLNMTEASAASILTQSTTTATNTTGLNNTVGTAGSAIPTKGLIVQGSDGTNARAIKTASDGTVAVSLATNQPTLQSGSTTAVTQATAGNLNATVVGTGTFAVQNTNQANAGVNIGSVELTDGTNTANVITPGTPNANGNALLAGWTSQASTTYSLTAAGTSSVIDMSNFASVSFQVTSQYVISGGTSTVTAQWSNDNTNWFTAIIQGASNSIPATSTTTTGVWTTYKAGRYFRLNITGTYVSGTAAGLIIPSTSPIAYVPATGVTSTPTSFVTTGTITTSSSSIITGSLSGYTYSIVSVHGTYAGVTFGITVSDDTGTTFYNASVYDVTNNKLINSSSITPASNASNLYMVLMPGYTSELKVLASAYTSGTANIRISSIGGTPPSVFSNSFLTDAAGNNRGANVDSANRLIVNDGLMPLNTTLNTYEAQITTTTTTTPTAATAYISSITLLVATGAATGTLTIQDKQGTPIKVVSLFSTAVTATTPVIYNFQTPIKMTSGIDIITATASATVNVWINYYQ